MKYILVVLLCLFVSVSVGAKVSEKAAILNACAAEFGSAVDAQQNLFPVNRFYVLKARFTKQGKLFELAVMPKHYFEESHPDWVEPDDFQRLSKSEYEELLQRLERIKSKGHLVKGEASMIPIANLTALHSERYEHAVLAWGEVADLRRPNNAPVEVRWIKVEFMTTGRRN